MNDANDEIQIAPELLSSPDAKTLITALNAEIMEHYPNPEDNFFSLAEAEVAPSHGVFLIARRNSIAIGCGAIRRIEDEPITFELKRMFTTRAARGIGLGRKLLAALEAEARARGGQRLVLETGELQAEAVRLYERAGFTRIPKFGEYVDAPLSLCMGKTLD